MPRIGRCELTDVLHLNDLDGALFQGTHTGLRRAVTLWVGAPEPEGEAFRARAKVISRQHHPHLARVLDFGHDQGRPYLVLDRLAPLASPHGSREAAAHVAAASEALEVLGRAELGLHPGAELRRLLGQGQGGLPILVPGPLSGPGDPRQPLPELGRLLHWLLTGRSPPRSMLQNPGELYVEETIPRRVMDESLAADEALPRELVELCRGCLREERWLTLAGVARTLRDYARAGSLLRGLTLRFRGGRQNGQVHHLRAPGILVAGRGTKVDLALADEKASRLHCEVSVDESGAARLRDLGSTHGTVRSGQTLAPQGISELADGDTLRLGETVLDVRLWEGCPPPNPPLGPGWAVRPLGSGDPFAGPSGVDPFGPAPGADPFGGPAPGAGRFGGPSPAADPFGPAPSCARCGRSVRSTGAGPLCAACAAKLAVPGYDPTGEVEVLGRSVFTSARALSGGDLATLEELEVVNLSGDELAALNARLAAELESAAFPGAARGRVVPALGGKVVVAWEPLGASLELYLQSAGAWSWTRARPVLERLGATLAAAHAAGRHHGDVSVARVRFTDTGHPRLLWHLRLPVDSAPHTVAAGPLDHLPPEALQDGRSLDARSDVYAFAVLVFRVLLARPLFAHKRVAQQLQAILDQPPDLEPLRPLVPTGVVEVLARSLAKKPEERFADLGEVLRALEAPG